MKGVINQRLKGSDNLANEGWIKLHRSLQENDVWKEERFSRGQAWVDLLLMANHSDCEVWFNREKTLVKRGQLLTSATKLAEKWQWDRKTVSSYLKRLELDNMTTIRTDNRKTLITIENYGFYQYMEENVGQQNVQQAPQLIGQQIPHKQEYKENNNINNTYIDTYNTRVRACGEKQMRTDIPLMIRQI